MVPEDGAPAETAVAPEGWLWQAFTALVLLLRLVDDDIEANVFLILHVVIGVAAARCAGRCDQAQ
jgi:hypothetical protein